MRNPCASFARHAAGPWIDQVPSKGGYIDVTPDVVPYIGSLGDLLGLTVATGFSGHGFGIGPGAGQLAAQLATNQKPSVDATPFRASRFSDGSPIVIGPEI